MSRSMRVFLCLAMAAAVCLLAALASDYVLDTRELRSLEKQLAESRTAWETTAAAKENLQGELSQVNGDIREATLTIGESATRAASLKKEIEQLEREIAALKKETGE